MRRVESLDNRKTAETVRGLCTDTFAIECAGGSVVERRDEQLLCGVLTRNKRVAEEEFGESQGRNLREGVKWNKVEVEQARVEVKVGPVPSSPTTRSG